MTDEDVNPISPQMLIEGHPDARYNPDYSQGIMNYINGVLSVKPSRDALLAGDPVAVYDRSDSEQWHTACEEAIQRFRSLGWRIRSVGEDFYYFSLPEVGS